ncbi:MAG: LamG domain-containing protein, partial [Planctomycetes bacterium]|nr:LamG domain-containing protein [Planctomycetota bacterium]
PYIIAMDLGQNWSFEAEYKMNSSNGLNTLFSYGNYTDGVLVRTLRGDSLYVKGTNFNQIDVFGTSNTNGVFVPVKITYTTTGTTGTLSIYASGSLIKSVTTNSPLNPVDKTIRLGSAYHNNGEGFDGAVRNIKVTVGVGSASISQINILAVNDKPVIATGGSIVSYTENAAATVIDAGITISDADDTNLASATVTITNAVTGDVLSFNNNNSATYGNISGNYANGVLTLSGTATLAQYQAALRSVTYLSTSEDPTVGNTRNNRTITWSVTDSNSDAVGAQISIGVTSTINIAAVNDASVMTAGANLGYTEGVGGAGLTSGNSLTLNGSNQFVVVGNSSDNVLTNGTIEGWIKTSNAGGGYSGIIVKQSAYSLFLYNNELITFDWSGVGNISTGRFLNDNAWHHVAMSFQSGVNAGTVIYLDGEAILTTRYTVPSTGVALALGAGFYTGGQNFAGSIDEVRIWNVVRTASEIASNRNVSVEANSPGLVSYFKLDETSGTTAYNSVTGGVNGTLVNNPTWNTASGGINGTT